jgi:GTPase SAR1 family protein
MYAYMGNTVDPSSIHLLSSSLLLLISCPIVAIHYSTTITMSANNNNILYGQVVVGAPGAGKTTFCNGMQQYLRLLGRNAWVLNLDPANEFLQDNEQTYDTLWNVTDDVIHLRQVMEDLELGPNGGLLYCMEYLDEHADEWIPQILEKINNEPTPPYLLIDLPGQSEVYTHGTSVSKMLQKIVKRLNLRLAVVQLVDATQCRDATQFLSSTVVGLATMIRLELPTVSVLSKSDLLLSFGGNDLLFGMDYFLDCQSLDRLVDYIDTAAHSQQDVDIADDPEYQAARRKTKQSKFHQKHRKMFTALAEVVEDYGLLNFMPLDIQNAKSVGQVLQRIDQANGYVFTGSTNVKEDLFQVAVQERENRFETISEIQERLQQQTEASAANQGNR